MFSRYNNVTQQKINKLAVINAKKITILLPIVSHIPVVLITPLIRTTVVLISGFILTTVVRIASVEKNSHDPLRNVEIAGFLAHLSKAHNHKPVIKFLLRRTGTQM